MPNSIFNYTAENRGRVLLLFLLFLLAIYEFVTVGISNFAIICILPFVVLYIYVIFRWRMFTFWTLIVVNYFLQMKDIKLPVPMSLPTEMLELILIAIAIIDARQTPHFNRAVNIMFLAISIWCGLCLIEILNDSCNLGINVGVWFTGFRLMAIQFVWILLVFSIYVSSPQILITYLKVWALFCLFSAIWTYKQINYGMTDAERLWLETRGRNTHILNAGTLIRYFSTFSDAANYGCHAAAAATAFIIFGVTNKINRAKVFFLLVAVAVIWGMFQSGTRTGIFCLGAGLIVYIFLSKSVKIAVPFSIVFAILGFLLVFTKIGDGNQQIHRMRSAFDKNDASANVRDINKDAIRKYIKDAPWGIGLGMSPDNVPANNKFRKLSTIPPDSEYVFIWVHTGPIGVSVFAGCMVLIFIGGCCVVLFRLKNKTLIGIGAGFCCAFVAINLGGYANQVLYQYPNGLTFFGGMAIVYILPYLEPEWEEYEKKRIAQIEEKKQLKLEKKLASRV
jgi:hypothetical protein